MALDLLTLQSLERTNSAVLNDAENTIIRVLLVEKEEIRIGNEISFKNIYDIAATKNGKRYDRTVSFFGPNLRKIEEYGSTEALNRDQELLQSFFENNYARIAEDIYYDDVDNESITFDTDIYEVEAIFKGNYELQFAIEVSSPPPPPSPQPPPKPQEVVEQRKQKEQLKKDRVEQEELTSTDIEGINNAVAEDQNLKDYKD